MKIIIFLLALILPAIASAEEGVFDVRRQRGLDKWTSIRSQTQFRKICPFCPEDIQPRSIHAI